MADSTKTMTLGDLVRQRSAVVCTKEQIEALRAPDRLLKPSGLPRETKKGDAELYHSGNGRNEFRILYKSGDGNIRQFVVTKKEINNGDFDGINTDEDFVSSLIDAQFNLTLHDVSRGDRGSLDQTIQAVAKHQLEKEREEVNLLKVREDKQRKDKMNREAEERAKKGFEF